MRRVIKNKFLKSMDIALLTGKKTLLYIYIGLVIFSLEKLKSHNVTMKLSAKSIYKI